MGSYKFFEWRCALNSVLNSTRMAVFLILKRSIRACANWINDWLLLTGKKGERYS